MTKSKSPAPAPHTRPASDACPQCGGAFVIDDSQTPTRLITHATLNASIPSAAARYAEIVTEKAERDGWIHRCAGCGYRDRFHPKDQAA